MPDQEIINPYPIKDPGNQHVVTISQAEQEEATLMTLIAKMASDPAADVPKLERLIALRDKEVSRRQQRAYDIDFAAMKPNLPTVIKTHYNSQTKSKYAKLGDINKEIDPILGNFGFGTSMQLLAQDENTVTVRSQVRHKDGHIEFTDIKMPLDNKGPNGTINKTGPHALLSAIEYAKRGGLGLLLNISTGEDKDGNGEDHGNITVEQAADLDTRLRAISSKALSNFLVWAKVETLTDISAQNYKICVKAVSNMEQEKAKS